MFRKRNDTQQGSRDNVDRMEPRQVFCRVCGKVTQFSYVWRRKSPQVYCMNCGLEFDDVQSLYNKFGPKCPRCDEPIESIGFDYGLCDECGSKYELVAGSKPSWLPNQAQREEMNRFGRSRNVIE
ncbi:MAG: hypothetical protein J7M12_01375 [Candidatus Hydrogenedentes bacterium]|nr:hypothetical protein [Candidatus Hydrogenedentota bacterium]